MKYLVSGEVDPVSGIEMEAQPERMQEAVGRLQALNPLGFYFHLTRRGFTAIVDVPNEDALLEALHGIWAVTKSYPTVTPVIDAGEFPKLMQRVGVVK